jgi:hypothetical protein
VVIMRPNRRNGQRCLKAAIQGGTVRLMRPGLAEATDPMANGSRATLDRGHVQTKPGAGTFLSRPNQELVASVSSMSLSACPHASMPGACGLIHHPTTPAASLATPHDPLGSFGRMMIESTPAIWRDSI